jgi:taurine dioxygenase
VPQRRFGPRPWVRAERERLAALAWKRIEVRPLGATIGAEIGGASLGALDDETSAEIERALLAYKVVFFRDQDITSEEHLAFARRFGELEEHPFIPAKPGYEKIVLFAKDAAVKGVENVWHSDVTWREIPSLGSVLRAVEVPRVGGDTLFADMYAAYDGLDPALKERLEGLFAVHDFVHTFGLAMTPAEREEQRRRYPEARHPVVRTHPATGRKALYVNAIFTRCIEGLPAAESDALLDYLYRQADVPEYQCRFRWAPGSVAFWDNRAVQHYAASDYDPERRVMERVTVIGDRPV